MVFYRRVQSYAWKEYVCVDSGYCKRRPDVAFQEVDAMNGKSGGQHHVVKNNDGGWDVKRSGAARASGHFDTKQDAIDAARIISRNQGTELFIHNKDGKIGQKDSHGNDPFPPRG